MNKNLENICIKKLNAYGWDGDYEDFLTTIAAFLDDIGYKEMSEVMRKHIGAFPRR